MIKTDFGENITINLLKDGIYYTLEFIKENAKKCSELLFKVREDDSIYIISVTTIEKNIGWCSFMLRVFMNLITKWEKKDSLE